MPATLGIEDKVFLVTGGNKGIGSSIVDLLEDSGAKVAYTYRTSEGDHGSLAIQADVRDAEAMKEATERVEEELGPIYGVVANAGITKDGLFVKSDLEQWNAVIETNLTGVYNTVLPVCRR